MYEYVNLKNLMRLNMRDISNFSKLKTQSRGFVWFENSKSEGKKNWGWINVKQFGLNLELRLAKSLQLVNIFLMYFLFGFSAHNLNLWG